MSEPLSVHVLSDGYSLARWQVNTLRQLHRDCNVELRAVIVNTRSETRPPVETLQRLTELGAWGLIVAYRTLRAPPAYAEGIDLREVDIFESASFVEAAAEPIDGSGMEVPEHGVDVLRDSDTAIRMGYGFLKGDALTAPRLGVLSFHHGDFRAYRGPPAGFWEFVNGETRAGVTVQVINERLDAGDIAAETQVDIRDAASWREVQRRLFSASPEVLVQAVQSLQDGSLTTVSESELGPMHTLPRGWDVGRFLHRSVEARVRRWIRVSR